MFILKLYDTSLLQFEVLENLADPVVRICWINEDKQDLLPLGMTATDESLAKWLKHRTIPKNRAYVNAFLAKCGLNANRPMDVISVCHGLSLNDAYWVCDEHYSLPFDRCNLYENRFSNVLAWTAFTGYGSSVRSTFTSSPEFTTNGMLPKCWRRENRKISLYKGATNGFSNAGCEPFSELYASQIGQKLGVNVIPYKLKRWKGNLCSVCELFTSKEISYVPIGHIVPTGGMKAVRAYYKQLGPEFVDALDRMIVFDALICNTDRHYGNFGVLVDSKSRKIIRPAPLFDHGNSLFNYAGDENWCSEETLAAYAATLAPVAYADFIEEARSVMNHELRQMLHGALNIEIENSGRYNYPPSKLRLMEKMIRLRAAELIKG